MKTILVTGGAGFIGSNLCDRLLTDGYKVINLDNLNSYYDPAIKERNIKSALKNENYQLYREDILDKKALDIIFEENSIDIIVHLAAMAGVRNSLKNPMEYVDIDIKGTVNLLDISAKKGIEKFIFASSSSVYGVNSKIPFAEDDSVDLQVSPYATAKRAGELFCSTYSRLYNMNCACLRFFTVYGPRQRPEMAIHKFVNNIISDKPIDMYGDGSSIRDYTYIDDIVEGILGVVETDFKFEVFNLGNNETISLVGLIETIEKIVGKKAIVNNMSMQKGDVPATYADIKKSKIKIGYNPKVKIDDGIDRFYKWFIITYK